MAYIPSIMLTQDEIERYKRQLDLRGFYAEAANLDLPVKTTEILNGAVRQEATPITASIRASARRRGRGVGDKPLRC